MIEPLAASLRVLFAQASAPPQLLIAPALVGLLGTGRFIRALPLDLQAST